MTSLHPSRPIIPIIIFFLLFFFPDPTRSQPSGNNAQYSSQTFNPTMGVIIIVLVGALFFMGFFSVYIRHCAGRTSTAGASRRGIVPRSVRPTRGLDRAVVESFPTFTYADVKELKIGKGTALECAVCLTEFEDDETLRLIPKCDHVFHSDCIDPWLVGHTTCPVCRANLALDATEGALIDAPRESAGNDVVAEGIEGPASESDDEERESMEQPLHGRMSRNRTMRRSGSVGRPRWLGKLTRSLTTGHVAVKQFENVERFTLRLPEDVRKQIMSGRLERSTSLLVLPRETSSRRGYRTGPGPGFSEGSSSTARFGSSERWVFSLAPPFFSRAPSLKSPKVATSTSRQGSIRLPV